MNTKPRMCLTAWSRERTISVFNSNYAANGDRLLNLDKPWTVLSPVDFRTFKTHAEAITYAQKKAGNK